MQPGHLDSSVQEGSLSLLKTIGNIISRLPVRRNPLD
jgi:hypothetical protein